MIRFFLNDKFVETDLPTGSTVLDYVRYQKKLMATKIGCREGDCGACTILVGTIQNNNLIYQSMTSCLMPLGNANGKHIVTVEGINMKELSPVQQAMVDENGTQCGFCTPGFIMSLTGFVINSITINFDNAIKAIDGNICRCTGYKSIERAAKIIVDKIKNKPTNNSINWLVENNFIPNYFLNIKEKLLEIELQEINKVEAALVIGGGTDLIVQKHSLVQQSVLTHLFNQKSLKNISIENNLATIGAAVTVADFAASPLINAAFPNLQKHVKLVSSTPIRNMATLAGNIVNASPIGDFSVFLLALNAKIILTNHKTQREILLKDFYKGYKLIDKNADEIIEFIQFELPQKNTFFNFEKVCKRTHLDIATVNFASKYTLNENDEIDEINLATGGVAPYPKYLNNTVSFLQNKKITSSNLQQAIEILYNEVAPISDVRGTLAYKKLLLRQLFLANFQLESTLLKEVLHLS